MRREHFPENSNLALYSCGFHSDLRRLSKTAKQDSIPGRVAIQSSSVYFSSKPKVVVPCGDCLAINFIKEVGLCTRQINQHGPPQIAPMHAD
jgi:hypothetical protein